MTLLTVVVPVFNEERFVGELLRRVLASADCIEGEVEIVVVNDGSDDSSSDEVMRIDDARIKLIELPENGGKGAAVRAGIGHASGQFVLVQDADLEYNPAEIPDLLVAATDSTSENRAVYGSRVLGARQGSGVRARLGLTPGQGVPQWAFGILLSSFMFVVTGRWISDLLTGYKLYPRVLFQNWSSKTNGFETDHEITMRLNCLGFAVHEVPVTYLPRSKEMGKKIGPRDAVKAIRTIWRYRKCP